MKLLSVRIEGNYLIIRTDEGDFKNRIDYAPKGIVEKCRSYIGNYIDLTVRAGTGAGGKTWKELGWFVDLSKANNSKNIYKNKKTIRIQGGPGCGKTYQMMKIIRRSLIAGVKPEEICFLSFTNVAVDEAIGRVNKEMKKIGFHYSASDFINFSTVHKLADRLGGLQGDRMSEKKFKEFEKYIQSNGVKNNGIEYEKVFTKLGVIESIAERVKNDYLQAISYSRATGINYNQVLNHIFCGDGDKISEGILYNELYNIFKKVNDLSDFDDCIDSAVNGDLISKTGFKVVIVDEAQDLSINLWRVVRKIINNSKVGVICGDPDQAIMDVFGANSKTFEKFKVTSEHFIKRTRRLPKSHFDNLNTYHRGRLNHYFVPMENAIYGTVEYFYDSQYTSALTDLIDKLDLSKEYLILSPTKSTVKKISAALEFKSINHYRSNELLSFNSESLCNIRVQTIWTSKGAEADNTVIALLSRGDEKQYKKYPALRYVAESRSKNKMIFLNKSNDSAVLY